MEYLVTYYVKNTNSAKDIFNVIPYASSVVNGSENEVLELVASKLKKNPFFRCCSVMDHCSGNKKVFETKFILDNPHFKEDALQKEFKVLESVDHKEIDDSGKNVNESARTEDVRKSFEVKLDHEKKVIRIGAYFYDLKGVLICEATEEDKKKYYCNRFITFPIVDEDWKVLEDEDISDGLERLIVGKTGDTIPLGALKDAADYNAREHVCGYDELLVGLERKGITISNRKAIDSPEELSDTVVIELSKIPGKHHFRLDSHQDSYYIPRRFFHVGTDDELYQDAREGKKQTQYLYDKIVQQIADDVFSLSWFFHKPNLKVLVIAYAEESDASHRYKIGPVPTDWFYTVQTLEGDINRKLDDMYKEEPDKFYKEKRFLS
ncbi:hypothetical protein [Prevotella sp. E2-28]|uniref:hypothetical protein n=1 Tax=Prevotella sp. E2-28 TaxID=2913620 RepID=UPI001EDB0EE7|nr:hypothetical protein [Prevotella sp. E2-28]UKK55133.1 hypothetical protein L6465_14950 [Prevotella sp. E2-28]